MKKITFVLFLLFVIALAPSLTFAQVTDNGLGCVALNVPPALKIKSKGTEVLKLQELLNTLGFNAGNADGNFGVGTKRAVKAFQANYGLYADGSVGKITAEKIKYLTCSQGLQNKECVMLNVPPNLQIGVKSGEVAKLQKYIKSLGYNSGPADGIFGNVTRRAIFKYQSESGLKVDGVVGVFTAKKIKDLTCLVSTTGGSYSGGSSAGGSGTGTGGSGTGTGGTGSGSGTGGTGTGTGGSGTGTGGTGGSGTGTGGSGTGTGGTGSGSGTGGTGTGTGGSGTGTGGTGGSGTGTGGSGTGTGGTGSGSGAGGTGGNAGCVTPNVVIGVPNGGEVYNLADTVTVKWTSCGLSADLPTVIELMEGNNILLTAKTTNTGDSKLFLDPNILSSNVTINFGKYFTIRVSVWPGIAPYYDVSDDLFTILKTSNTNPTTGGGGTVTGTTGGGTLTGGSGTTGTGTTGGGTLTGGTGGGTTVGGTGNSNTTCLNPLPWIAVANPNGGMKYPIGQDVKIQWKFCNWTADNVYIKLIMFTNTNNGALVNSNIDYVLAKQTANDGEEIVKLVAPVGTPAFQPGDIFKIEVGTLGVGSDQSDGFSGMY